MRLNAIHLELINTLTSHAEIHLVRMRVLVEVGRQLEHLNWGTKFHICENILHDFSDSRFLQNKYFKSLVRTFTSGLAVQTADRVA